jgi:hypothetical protein
VIHLGVAGPEVPNAVVRVAAVSEVAASGVGVGVYPEVLFVVDPGVCEPGVFFVALVSVLDAAEPPASVDIALAFRVLAPVSVFVAEVDSLGPPTFLVSPNADYHSSSSSSSEVVDKESVHSSTGDRANHGLCSILSSLGLHQNRNLEQCCNNPNPGHNNVNDTNDLPIDATTNHSRRRGLHQCQGQRKHSYPVSLPPRVVQQIRWAVAEKFQHLYLPLPLLEWERQLPTPKTLLQEVTSSFCCLLSIIPPSSSPPVMVAAMVTVMVTAMMPPRGTPYQPRSQNQQ